MSLDDFMREYDKMEICSLGPDVMDEVYEMTGVRMGSQKDVWATNNHDSAWIRNSTAGGCRNFIGTFADNPQFRITLTDADPDDADNLCTCIIGVLQKYRRNLRAKGLDNLPIGFALYEADRADGKLETRFFRRQQACARSPVFINLREICGRYRLSPGTYVLVPSTFEPNSEGEFVVRLFTNAIVESEELS